MEEHWLQVLCFVAWVLCLRLAAISRHLATRTTAVRGTGAFMDHPRSARG